MEEEKGRPRDRDPDDQGCVLTAQGRWAHPLPFSCGRLVSIDPTPGISGVATAREFGLGMSLQAEVSEHDKYESLLTDLRDREAEPALRFTWGRA
jgi:hypothetical protein